MWDKDTMVELFAKQGDDLSIHEKDGGKRVSLTLTDKYNDVVWQIKCSGLDGGSTKLMVRDSTSHTIRFRQGDTDLWTVNRYGDEDINVKYCEFDLSDGGGGADRCDDKDNWLFYHDKNKDMCWWYCVDDNNEKLWTEVDCKGGGDDRCDDSKNCNLKWNAGKEKCYKVSSETPKRFPTVSSNINITCIVFFPSFNSGARQTMARLSTSKSTTPNATVAIVTVHGTTPILRGSAMLIASLPAGRRIGRS